MAETGPDDVLAALRAALATPEAAALLQSLLDAFAEVERIGRAGGDTPPKIKGDHCG